MQLAIIGLPLSGKTTIFNAATRGAAQVASYSGASKPNLGIAKVPDDRLGALTQMYRPEKTTPAEVAYIDLPAPPDGMGQTRGIYGEYLNQMQNADALIVVARAFEDPTVADAGDGVDALRDIETMLYELTFADLDILSRRLERIEQNLKGSRRSDRDAMLREKDTLSNLSDALEDGIPIRENELPADTMRRVNEFQFLTAKPLIAVVNAGDDTDEASQLQKQLDARLSDSGVNSAVIQGGLEMEFAQMSREDEGEFRDALGAGESGLARMVRLSFDALDQISFFTGGPKEVRAWTTSRGDSAPRAASRIHSDMERGFIRAEVVSYEDLITSGSESNSRKLGLMRQEGKDYTVQDGDVVHILFNV